jgi:hypothetical protein
MRYAMSLADRMLSALVPQKTAAAGCSGVFYLKCSRGTKQCNWHPNCTYTCGPCS